MHSEDFRYLESRVKAQYEAFPYPDIETANRMARLWWRCRAIFLPSTIIFLRAVGISLCHFACLWRVAAPGLRRYASHSNCSGQVVRRSWFISISEESRRIAERRAQSFGLDNIDFHTGSLIDLPSLGLGVFDYIDCGGVLHHLEEPAAGLTALTEVMAAEGGMGLMMYGLYGRAGIYPIQEMMRRLGAGNQSDQLPLLKKVLDGLPATNLLHHHERFRQGYGENDAELVDLFLHPVDRPFTVPELTQLCERAGLRVVRFTADREVRTRIIHWGSGNSSARIGHGMA